MLMVAAVCNISNLGECSVYSKLCQILYILLDRYIMNTFVIFFVNAFVVYM